MLAIRFPLAFGRDEDVERSDDPPEDEDCPERPDQGPDDDDRYERMLERENFATYEERHGGDGRHD